MDPGNTGSYLAILGASAIAMVVDAPAALLLGSLFDKHGLKVLIWSEFPAHSHLRKFSLLLSGCP